MADLQISMPPYAYVPGQTPRHDPAIFAGLHDSVQVGMSATALAQSAAWKAALLWYDAGYYWEVHEMAEPVWMALPKNSAARGAVQAFIHLTNARLKLRMERPNATLRLVQMARALLDGLPERGQDAFEGLDSVWLRRELASLVRDKDAI